MKPYYEDSHVKIFNKDCRDMSELPDESIDLIATDPPYGIAFMGKDWDRALPDKRIWEECLRVLKQGAFAFVMSIPRADCLSRMIISLEDAGFWVNFTPIFWAMASGFPKAQNIGKALDKKLGVESKVLGQSPNWRESKRNREQFGSMEVRGENAGLVTEVVSPQAKALDGSYAGFQPKPAVEVILVAMKPLSEKTYVDQAMKNRKGITWLDDGKIPYETDKDKHIALVKNQGNALKNRDKLYGGYGDLDKNWQKDGRFPANLLVSDDVLNDGKVTKSTGGKSGHTGAYSGGYKEEYYGDMKPGLGDSGSFSRYFDLDRWFSERVKELPESVQRTFPFLIVPKASKSEKNKGCEDLPPKVANPNYGSGGFSRPTEQPERQIKPRGNYHPTCKPVKLMSYLITLGSREGDTVVDPFIGTGSTAIACQILARRCTGYEINSDYCEIAKGRLSWCRQRVMDLSKAF